MTDSSDRRRHPRRKWKIKLRYNLNSPEDLELIKPDLYCKTIDISADGLCLETDYPVEPGHVLSFGNRLTGITRWSTRFDNSYRIGIKFI